MKFAVKIPFPMAAVQSHRHHALVALCFVIALAFFNINSAHATWPKQVALREFGDWPGTVTYVVDGDTLYVRPAEGGKPVAVRIDGIDAPEICQFGGLQARDALSQRVLGQQVLVRPKANDRYGRMVASIFKDRVDQGAQMVATGQAWAFRFDAGRGAYAALQRSALATRLGIFASGLQPQTPALFRKTHGSCY